MSLQTWIYIYISQLLHVPTGNNTLWQVFFLNLFFIVKTTIIVSLCSEILIWSVLPNSHHSFTFVTWHFYALYVTAPLLSTIPLWIIWEKHSGLPSWIIETEQNPLKLQIWSIVTIYSSVLTYNHLCKLNIKPGEESSISALKNKSKQT